MSQQVLKQVTELGTSEIVMSPLFQKVARNIREGIPDSIEIHDKLKFRLMGCLRTCNSSREPEWRNCKCVEKRNDILSLLTKLQYYTKTSENWKKFNLYFYFSFILNVFVKTAKSTWHYCYYYYYYIFLCYAFIFKKKMRF